VVESIKREQEYLKHTLAKKLKLIQEEKAGLLQEMQMEESARITSLQAVIDRILSEKNHLEELLREEVAEK
jgi:hypothetical protein